jgi:hypothetical protein
MSGWFKPLHGKVRTQAILAFDIEGTGEPGGFVCGSIAGEALSAFYTSREALHQDLVHYGRDGYWIWSHNLQYDLPILEGDDFPLAEMLFTRYSLISAIYPGSRQSARFYDSTNLFPRHTVEMLGEMVSAPKGKLPEHVFLQLTQGRPWEHFTPFDQELIRRYNQCDSWIVYRAVVMLQELVNSLGGELRPTIAGTAMDLYRRAFHKWPWPAVDEGTNEYTRPAYYGGRVENFAIGTIPHVNGYDITSLYPSSQKAARFPHPAHLELLEDPRSTSQPWLGEGVAHVEVEVPDVFIPSLPHRQDNRLFFPIGTMSGLWTLEELRAAQERGVRVKALHWILRSAVTFNPFQEFVEKLFELRLRYLQSGERQANLVKLLLNSLYGRWGLNPTHGLQQIRRIERGTDLATLKGFQTLAYGDHLVAIGSLPTMRYPDYINVLFAAQITSCARVRLLDELIIQDERMVYCDTDSILTTGEINTGKRLGEWRETMHDGEAEMVGLKEYTLRNAVIGERYVAKGVPPELQQEYLKTGVARYFRALGIREALRDRRRPATWIETLKGPNACFPKRYPLAPWQQPEKSYRPTRPYRAEELPLVVLGLFLPPDVEPVFPGRAALAPAPEVQADLF